MRIIHFAIALSCALPTKLWADNPQDACTKLISENVKQVVTKDFPGYNLPLQSDNKPSDYASSKTKCLGVAVGNFLDENQQATALLLYQPKEKRTLLVVAFQQGEQWQSKRLEVSAAERNVAYVSALPAGEYMRSPVLDGPVTDPLERERYTSKRAGIATGTIEAGEISYFYTGTEWVHVWTAD